MNKRITIVCSEQDKIMIEQSFYINCPFQPYTEYCKEDAECDVCIEDNVKFVITDKKENGNGTC